MMSTNEKRKYENDDPLMRILRRKMDQGETVIEKTDSKPLSWLLDLQKEEMIEIYKKQRVPCWPESDQREYIEKSFDRDHNPLMLIRKTIGKPVPYEIGDAGNRATAFENFVNDRFPIYLDDGEGVRVKVYYSELSEPTKQAWRMHTNVSILQLQNISDDMFDDRIDRMNSGTKMQRAEHIRLKVHLDTPRCLYLKTLFDRYQWATKDLRVQGKGDDLICQVVHQLFKTKNKRTTGGTGGTGPIVEEMDEGAEQEAEEEEDASNANAPNNITIQRNRFPYQAVKRPILEKFCKKTDDLDPNTDTAQAVNKAFDDLTIVFNMPATTIPGIDKSQLAQVYNVDTRIVDFWAGKIKSNSEYKYFERGMRALALANIYDGVPINKETYEFAIVKTNKIYNDATYSTSFDYLQQGKFHEIPEAKEGGKVFRLNVKKHSEFIDKLRNINKRHKVKEIKPIDMHLWELTGLTSEHYIKIEVHGENRYFEIFDKQPDIENKVREILRIEHAPSRSSS